MICSTSEIVFTKMFSSFRNVTIAFVHNARAFTKQKTEYFPLYFVTRTPKCSLSMVWCVERLTVNNVAEYFTGIVALRCCQISVRNVNKIQTQNEMKSNTKCSRMLDRRATHYTTHDVQTVLFAAPAISLDDTLPLLFPLLFSPIWMYTRTSLNRRNAPPMS